MKNFKYYLLFLLLIPNVLNAYEYAFGYRLDYTTQDLKASDIDPAFVDFKSGHTSAFFFRLYFDKQFYFETAPGAWNSEEGNAQFTFQYNTIGLGYQWGENYILDVGANIGGALYVLSNSNQSLGNLQTNATVLRKDAALCTAQVGFGYKWDRFTGLFNIRHFGFLDSDLKKLDNTAAGISIAFDL